MVGRQLGNYRITRIIGTGGYGVVYEAVHVSLGQRVAVKMPKAELSQSAQYRERFLREARACCQVQHPGLVQVFDCGELEDGTPYFQMEYLDGVTLRQYLDETLDGALAIELVLRLAQQIAAAMAVSHQSGIVHRDLKPDNVMLVKDPAMATGRRTKVFDFGIAKFTDSTSQLTLSTEGLFGTPSYMAPEQCRKDDNLDGKIDVYALGCILYQMICGAPPFTGDSAEVLRMHLFKTPQRPRQRRPKLHRVVEALILDMLDKDVTTRPAMAMVAAELERLVADPRRMRGWFYRPLGRRRVGTKFALGIGMLVLLVLLTFLSSYFLHYPQRWRADMRKIEGGLYEMGIDDDERIATEVSLAKPYPEYLKFGFIKREQPKHKVLLSSFRLDTTEVTNQRFGEWLSMLQAKGLIVVEKYVDTQGKNANHVYLLDHTAGAAERLLIYNLFGGLEYNGISFDNKHFVVRRGMELRPVTTVTWIGAERFCRAHNKRLPSEAEWEFAARSRGKYRFPWGDDAPSCAHAVIERGPEHGACLPLSPPLPNVASASKDLTEQGVYDMAGSVNEWVADYFHLAYAACEPYCRNPLVSEQGPDPQKELAHRVLRGGAWSTEFPSARATGRMSLSPDITDADTGFRCAKSIE